VSTEPAAGQTDEEFLDELRAIVAWDLERGYKHPRIDPGLDPAMSAAFVAIGAGDLLHPETQ
jgi:hypothetical protein